MNRRCFEKIGHPDLLTALDALVDARRRRATNMVRVFKCDRCEHWHTTSQARETIRRALEVAFVTALLFHPPTAGLAVTDERQDDDRFPTRHRRDPRAR